MSKGSVVNVVKEFNGKIVEGSNGVLEVFVPAGFVSTLVESETEFKVYGESAFSFTLTKDNELKFPEGAAMFRNLRAYIASGENVSTDMYYITSNFDLYSFLTNQVQKIQEEKVVKDIPKYDHLHGRIYKPDGMFASPGSVNYSFSEEYKQAWEDLLQASAVNQLLTEENIKRINAEIDHMLDTRQFDKIPALIELRDKLKQG